MSEKVSGEEASLSPEVLALLEDFAAYVNPEAILDPKLPQTYWLPIPATSRPSYPRILELLINGEALPLVMRGAVWMYLDRGDGRMADVVREKYGYENLDKFLKELFADEEYLKVEKYMVTFFLRNLPELFTRFYGIVLCMTVESVFKLKLAAPADRAEYEESVRRRLNVELRELGKDIKRRIGTRGRGGSQPKLHMDELQALHVRYDDLYKRAKRIKRHYDEVLAQFTESRGRQGFKHRTWQQFWSTHAAAMYADEDTEFLALFAQVSKPSASEVAYTRLSKQTGHKRSYIERLVRDSRRSAAKGGKKTGQ
ncbi:MAG: hypothetical protein LC800_02325 [Acidobacteria bacterium]|nr:hypothetical protein [Acidobacteriota bacterium]